MIVIKSQKIDDKNEYKLLFQRVGLVAISNALLSFSGIILLPILTKNLSIEEYGYWSLIVVTIGMVVTISMLGLPFTLVRFLSLLTEKEKIQEIFYSMFLLVILISILISSIIYLFSKNVAYLLFDGNVIIVKLMSIIIFIECCNSFLIGYLRAREQIKRYSMLNTTKTIIQIISIALLVLSGKGIIGAEIGLLISSLVIFIFLNSIIVSEIGIKVPRFENIKEYLNFGIPTVPSNLSNWIVNASDRYVIGFYLGPASVGYYSPGYSLGNIINFFSAPLNFILPATLSKHYDNNNIDKVKNILNISLKYYLIFAIPSFFGLSLLSKPLLFILTTPEIASNGYLITPFIALSSLLFGIYSFYQKIIILEKKTIISAKIWSTSACVNLLLNILLIPYIGIIGAAYTTLIAFTLSLILILWISSKYLKLSIGHYLYLKVLISSAIMSLVILLMNPISLWNLISTIFLCIFIYFAMLFFLNVITKEDVMSVKSLFLSSH